MSTRWKLFDDLAAALQAGPDTGDDGARLDPHRAERAGVPEVVYGGAKSPEAIARYLRRLATANGRAMASRCSADAIARIHADLGAEFAIEVEGMTVVAARPGTEAPRTGGRVGILTAGSSDRDVAVEALVIAREMGCEVSLASDVGVAGLHRLVGPISRLAADDVDVVIVAAGMDGALPSVVAGLVPVPVIGLPVATGYGVGGRGEAALGTMLQTCAPGLAVVNVDNGIGAGSIAALIANRAAAGRRG